MLSRNQRDFSERERLLLDLLRPHLIQAYRQAEEVTRVREEMARFKHGLEESAAGFIFMDHRGLVNAMTERARQLMEEYFGRTRSAHARRLPEALQCWVDHQVALLTESGEAPALRIPLIMQRAGKRLSVRLLTDPHAGQLPLLLSEEQANISPRTLEPLGLTQREAEVLLWVMQGKTNMETAAILSIRPRTVHKHLEHIYQKLGVETRTAATLRALEVLGLLRR